MFCALYTGSVWMNFKMESSEDVPPLEDMSDLIQQVDALRELKKKSENVPRTKHGQSNGHTESNVYSPKVVNNVQSIPNKSKTGVIKDNDTVKTKDNAPVQKQSGFGGMKKGFLFGSPAKPNQTVNKSKSETCTNTSQKKTLEDIPFIRKNDEAKSGAFKFSEVQEAMEKTTTRLMENKDWVTDDLMNKLEKNEKMTKRLQDPTFIQAIGEFQKNPQAALEKYGNNMEVQEFFQDFCGLMGDHFSNLSEKPEGVSGNASPAQSPGIVTSTPSSVDMKVRSSTNPNQPTAQDEEKMQQILSDPEIRLILMDPKIQDLFENLRNNPSKGERMLQQANPELKQKIQKLCSVGLLQFQSG